MGENSLFYTFASVVRFQSIVNALRSQFKSPMTLMGGGCGL